LILHFNYADFDSAQSAALVTQSCLLSLSKQAKFQTDQLPKISVVVQFEMFYYLMARLPHPAPFLQAGREACALISL